MKKIYEWIKAKLNICFVRRCSQPLPEEVKPETTPKIIKHKLMIIEILFNDGTMLSFSQKHSIDSEYSHVICFYHFYKWFFFRKDSEWYVFSHTDGSNIFKRENIKQINFKQKEVAENVS